MCGWCGGCRLFLHSRILSLSLAHRFSLAGLFLRICGMVMVGLDAVGEAKILQQKSILTTPRLLQVSIVAHTPFSIHSAKSARSRAGVGPAVGG